ncbi:MAG: SAM-dependent methyltransferase [Christensenellaceae bacterium]|nr:SAM-dependent methyltransferase [Christensenellaceae bacterium]
MADFELMKNIILYAEENAIPIIQKPALDFLLKTIKENNIKTVLEIGTAIGYSAINMALAGCDVYSIERDFERYSTAFDNVKNFNLEKKITLIFQDALLYNTSKQFDLLFIDGAKAQNIAFLEQYRHCLKPGSFVFVDNINFHDLTYNKCKLSRDLNQLTRKIRRYVDYIKQDTTFETQFFDIGDGIALSKLL